MTFFGYSPLKTTEDVLQTVPEEIFTSPKTFTSNPNQTFSSIWIFLNDNPWLIIGVSKFSKLCDDVIILQPAPIKTLLSIFSPPLPTIIHAWLIVMLFPKSISFGY